MKTRRLRREKLQRHIWRFPSTGKALPRRCRGLSISGIRTKGWSFGRRGSASLALVGLRCRSATGNGEYHDLDFPHTGGKKQVKDSRETSARSCVTAVSG
ncbi:hypothetical protein E2542_SST08841 [Spatholobus suberectus]|nr:hypothetical protein E2542_SST08841 [Spatholobus suberectus]